MTKRLDSARLQLLRKQRGLSQRKLARKAGLSEQSIYRWEHEGGIKLIRDKNLIKIADAFDCDPEVLTGGKPLPSDASPTHAAPEETAYQLNVRVDAAVRNAFELVARRYRISVPKIAQLAPLLFVVVAEASLKRRRQELDELRAARDRLEHSGLAIMTQDLDERIEAERESIEDDDIFGRKREGDSPFEAFLRGLTADDNEITIRTLDSISTDYRVCRSVAARLASDDAEVTSWLLNGEVPIHRMPRGFETDEERIEWIGQNRTSVNKIPEQILEEFPEDSSYPKFSMLRRENP